MTRHNDVVSAAVTAPRSTHLSPGQANRSAQDRALSDVRSNPGPASFVTDRMSPDDRPIHASSMGSSVAA
jgi:hypothetical protein